MNRELTLWMLLGLLVGAGAGSLGSPRGAAARRAAERGLPGARAPDQTAAHPAGSTIATARDAAADPRVTLQMLLEEQHPNRRREKLDALCASFDAGAARTFLDALPRHLADDALEMAIVEQTLARWAELEPRAAAEYAVRLDRERPGGALHAAVGAWAEADAAGAWQWAIGVADLKGRSYAINAVLGVMAGHDIAAALAAIETLPADEDRSFYVSSMFMDFARKDPSHAATLALGFKSAAFREVAVARVAEGWALREPGRAVAWFLEHQSTSAGWQWGDQALRNILTDWLRTAPEDVATFAAAMPAGRSRTTLLSEIGRQWGGSAPEAAADWLGSLPRNPESERALGNVIGAWSQNEPRRAGAFLLALPPDRQRDDLFSTFAQIWAGEDPDAALAWARSQAAPELEHLMAAAAIGEKMRPDLPNAERYLAELKTPKARTAAIGQVANSMAMRTSGAEEAVQWVMSLDPAHAIGDALRWPMEQWTQRQPEAAGAWLQEQPAGSRKDAALSQYASTLAQKNVASAAAWAATIGDAAVRQKRLKAIVGTWAGKDAAAARAWVVGQRLPAAERQELVQQLDAAVRK